jgi:hypothetical protein
VNALRASCPGSLHVGKLDDEGGRRIVLGVSSLARNAFSPDGEYLALYLRGEEAGSSELAICHVTDGACRRLGPDARPEAWLPIVAERKASLPTAAPRAPGAECTTDDDCAVTRPCPPTCASFTGATAPFVATTRAALDAALATCPTSDVTLSCPNPPPCLTAMAARCEKGSCIARVAGVYARESGVVGACRCDSCGPPPDLTRGDCARYAQVMYERCCCLESGGMTCDLSRWPDGPTACGRAAKCRPGAATLAKLPNLDGCAGVKRPP